MASRTRRIVRDLMPPAVTRAISERSSARLRFVDGYSTWAAAAADAGTYAEQAILDRVKQATDEVVHGRAAFERDGVTFDQPEYRWPIAAALLWRASIERLSVLDFGGSLGSGYRQMSPFLDDVDLSWGVVEQPAFVEAGREYEDGRLRFFSSIDDCVQSIAPTVALASAVLHYLPDPYQTLAALLGSGVDTVIVDRTPTVEGLQDLPVVQHVPAHIYEASYPTWLFSRERFAAAFPGWHVVAEFPTVEADTRTSSGITIQWHGLIAVRGKS